MGSQNLDLVHPPRVQSTLGTSPGQSGLQILAGLREFFSSARQEQAGVTPALGIMEPCSLGGLRSRFIAWISLLPYGRGSTGDMVASDKAPCAERRGKRVRATFQLAADEPSGAYDFTRLLLCVGSEFPTQR